MVDLTGMSTERTNPKSTHLSSMSIEEAVTLMNDEDLETVAAVKRAKPQIVALIEKSSKALQDGGRIIYMGAGTSGRLGVLDAVECPPTFGVGYNTVVGLIAGGDSAFVKAKEGAEDSREFGADDLKAIDLNNKDIVIGIAASGRTPYVLGGLEYARSIGCETGGVVCNENSPIAKEVEGCIELVVGPEVLTGSTRLKSGTATKMVLNMISTISMIGIGKVYGNYMVDVKMTNEKLVSRGIRIVRTLTGCSVEEAQAALKESGNSVKTAIAMIEHHCPASQAKALLDEAKGHLDRIPD